MTTLKEALKALESLRLSVKSRTKIAVADQLLGKYKGIIPKGKTSTQFIHQLRSALYD